MTMNQSNNHIFISTVATTLGISADCITDELNYNSIPEWDSISHMALVAALERVYDIMLDTDDIIGMSSIGEIRKILRKYDVAL